MVLLFIPTKNQDYFYDIAWIILIFGASGSINYFLFAGINQESS